MSINAALRGFAEAVSDGIIQASTGGAEFASGTKVKDMVTGALAMAEFTKVVADKYDITVALHTDHCPKDKLDTYIRPLIALSTERSRPAAADLPVAHVDGSAVPLDENLKIAAELLELTKAANIILEIEVGVVGGVGGRCRRGDQRQALHLSPDDFIATVDALGVPRTTPTSSRDLRQRARRLQAGWGQAASEGAARRPGRPGRQARPGRRRQAVLPGLPRRIGFLRGGDRRGRLLRRDQDDTTHRHPVRLHPADRGTTCSPTTAAC